MLKQTTKLFLEFLAGLAGNLVAAWIQQDAWHNIFTIPRIGGTIIGVTIMLIVIAWLDHSQANPIHLLFRKIGVRYMNVKPQTIRQLLNESLDDEQITNLCYDYFRPVYDKFTDNMQRSRKIHLLIDYCTRHGKTDQLLELIKKENPHQYYKITQNNSQ